MVLWLTCEVALAQEPPAQEAVQEGLKVIVLEGEGAVVSADRLTRPPVVEIRDLNDRPVEGAEVTFHLPSSGPGGAFPDGELVKTFRTNPQGQAAAVGFTPNQIPGRYTIRVTAKAGRLVGAAEIRQTNATGTGEPAVKTGRRWSWWKVAIVAGAGAAAAGIVLATTGGGGLGGGSRTITITPGPVIIGGGG
jgi:hypothetical protein